MKKLILIFSMLLLVCTCFTACGLKHDTITVYNRSGWVFDDIRIDTPSGYFYNAHEKLIVDNETVCVTIYFRKLQNGNWEERR